MEDIQVSGTTSPHRGKLAVAFFCPALLAVVILLTTPQAANAWTGSSHVHLWGVASCNTSYPVPTSRVRVQAANGEAHDASANTLTGYYAMDFNNVPSKGESAVAYVYCGLSPQAPTYGNQIMLSRPGVTDWLQQDLHK